MKAVIYICHGSRVEESKKEAFQLIDKVKQQVDIPIQETCFFGASGARFIRNGS